MLKSATVAAMLESEFNPPIHVQVSQLLGRCILGHTYLPTITVRGCEHRVKLTRAPEPHEIYWANFDVDKTTRR